LESFASGCRFDDALMMTTAAIQRYPFSQLNRGR
jgi:hypothetical protein